MLAERVEREGRPPPPSRLEQPRARGSARRQSQWLSEVATLASSLVAIMHAPSLRPMRRPRPARQLPLDQHDAGRSVARSGGWQQMAWAPPPGGRCRRELGIDGAHQIRLHEVDPAALRERIAELACRIAARPRYPTAAPRRPPQRARRRSPPCLCSCRAALAAREQRGARARARAVCQAAAARGCLHADSDTRSPQKDEIARTRARTAAHTQTHEPNARVRTRARAQPHPRGAPAAGCAVHTAHRHCAAKRVLAARTPWHKSHYYTREDSAPRALDTMNAEGTRQALLVPHTHREVGSVSY